MTTMAAPEQLLLELINRARLDPAGEAARLASAYPNLNFTLNEGLAPGTISADPKQPLAGNNLLAMAAEGHSNAMQASHVLDDAPGPNQRNPHTQAGDGTPEQRIAAQGYSQNPLPFYRNENVAVRGTSEALTDSVVEQLTKLIHDDLFVDTYASSRGHRLAMMDDNMREIGIGEVNGTFRDWQTGVTYNAVLVTQNFGVSGTQSFLTGVVYNDTRVNNDFYDIGEAVQGVVVTVNGVGSDTTGSGGGWSVGVPGGTYVVTYSGGGLATTVSATVEAGNRNAKLDLVNGNELWASANTILGQGAKDAHLLGIGDINATGNAGDNLLFSNKGNNVLDGAAGVDTAVFAGNRADYTITQGNGVVTVAGLGATDTLKAIEKIQFADQTIPAPGQVVPVAGSVAIGNVAITEGNAGTKVATFTVARSGGSEAFNVNFDTSNGSATTADNDYVGKSGVLQFAANEMSKTISVTLNGDTKVEANEAFNVLLSNATSGATISDGQGVGTIINDDVASTAGSVAIGNVTITEGNAGTKIVSFTVARSGGSAAFNVNFATSDRTAKVIDHDYVAKSGTLQFAANEMSKVVSFTVVGDTKVEANETFNVLLSNATNGATVSDNLGVATIINDDVASTAAGSVAIGNAVITEGDAGNKVVSFTVARSGGSAAFNVNFATSDGTAKVIDHDYVAKSGVLQFAANEMSKIVSFTVVGDAKVEINETFKVSLSGATNGATVSDNLGVATIINDDRAHEDFGGDGRSDVLWRNDNGSVAMWQMNNTQITSNTTIGSAGTNWHIIGTEDFGGDGRSDILWRSDSGAVAMWQMNGTQIVSNTSVGTISSTWDMVGLGDFNGDGRNDVLWENGSGQVAMWRMNGSQIVSNTTVGTVASAVDVIGTGDFNGDGRSDILMFNESTGAVSMWQMNGNQIAANKTVGSISSVWEMAGIADFNADGRDDILWRHDNGSVAMWQMNGSQIAANKTVGSASTAWDIADTGDYNGDGSGDILWRHDNGSVAMWEMNGTQIGLNANVGSASSAWHLV